MHRGVGVERVEGTEVCAHHVLLSVEIDNRPLAQRGHEDRVAAIAREAERGKEALLSAINKGSAMCESLRRTAA
jgi:hypothetical protein